MAEEEEMNEGAEEDENLLEDAEYTKKSDYSTASLVSNAIEKIREKRGQEMKAGYFNIITRPDGSVKKEYVQDTRREYVGSVEFLRSLLAHEIESSEKAKTGIKNFMKLKKKCFEAYSVPAIRIVDGRVREQDFKYIPEVDEEIPTEQGLQHKSTFALRVNIQHKRGIYNPQVKAYWDDMVIVYDYLFQELTKLIAEKNHFKQRSSY